METELAIVAVIALLQVVAGAPPVEVSQSKMTLLEKQTMTAVCRVGKPLSYCRFFLPQLGGFNLSPSIPSDKGIVYHGAGLERGECGIKISSIQKEHNGQITCHLGFPTESQESTGRIEIVVAQPPLTPKLNIKSGFYGPFFKEGEKIQADCRIEGGRPVANISWFLGTEPITEGLSSPNYETGPGDLQTVSQSLTLPVKYTDHGKDLRCVAGHIALGPSNINHSIQRLNINFPPKPKSSETEQFGFTIGQPGKVMVTFNANPKPNIHWEVGNERLTEGMKDSTRSFEALVLHNKGPGVWGAVLKIAKVTAKDVEKKYTLVAENELGREAYKVAISTSPAPPADITAGAIAGIVVAVLVILLIIFILIFARAFGKWCFAGSKPRRQTGESKYSLPKIGSLTYKNYKPVKTEDGKKIYVSPEDEKKIKLVSQMNWMHAVTFENEKQRGRRDSDSSDSMYETPISKSAPATPGESSAPLSDVRRETVSEKTSRSYGIRHSFPFYGRKRRLFLEDDSTEPSAKRDEEEPEGGLNLPPHIQEIKIEDESEGKSNSSRIKFPNMFRKGKRVEEEKNKSVNGISEPLKEQIPAEVIVEQVESREKEPSGMNSDLGCSSKAESSNSDKESKRIGERSWGYKNSNGRIRREKHRVTLKTIFGIETEGKKPVKEESFKEMQQKEDRELEDKILLTASTSEADQGKTTEFKGKEEEDEEENGEEDKALSEEATAVVHFPTNIPLRGRWGPKSRKTKAKSAPEWSRPEKEGDLTDSPVRWSENGSREGILPTKWKKNKQTRPVSFADKPTIFNIGSDTESADHGSADKSSVSKLTEEKHQKRFLGQLLDSIKRKNKDKVADNEALRNLPVTIDKDVEQQIQKDHIQKDHLKTDGIVYAELDMARSQGHVLRRDDEKTEYAEIIHPKSAEFKRSRDELRKSRENLSSSREHLTEDDGTTTTPDGKKEAAV